MPKCVHCDRAVRSCLARRPGTPCPPGCHGWHHYTTRAHRCQPQAPATYAQAKGS